MQNLCKILNSFFLISSTAFLTFFNNPLQADWSHPANVSATGFNTTGSQIAIDQEGRTIAIWSGFDGSNYVIQTSNKTLKGEWSQPITISPIGQDAFYPQIAIDQKGNLVAVWSGKINNVFVIQSSIKYQKKDWSKPINVSKLPKNKMKGKDALFPQVLFGNDGETYAIWQKNNGSKNVIKFATKEKANGSWSKAVTLSTTQNPGLGCTRPQFVINRFGDLFAVWINNERLTVQFSLKQFGKKWTLVKDLSSAGKQIQNAQIALDNSGNAVSCWTRSNGINMLVQATSRPKNGVWSNAVNLSEPGEDSLFPSLSLSNDGNAVIAWQRSDGVYSLIQAAVKIGNDTWSTAYDLTETGQDASNPQTATAPNNTALAVWKRSNGSNFVIQEASAIFGDAWSNPTTLSEDGEDAINPSASINAKSNASIIWQRSNGTDTIVQTTFNHF